MAKKKRRDPKDDLIDQLLDDVNDIAADPSVVDSDVDPHAATLSGSEPAGLTSVAQQDQRGSTDSPWDSLEGKFGSSEESESRDEVSANQFEVPSEFMLPEDSPGGHLEVGLAPEGLASAQVGDAGGYQGPSLGEGGYQSLDDLGGASPVNFESAEGYENEATRPISASEATVALGGDDRTQSIAQVGGASQVNSDHEATVAADGFANRRVPRSDPQEKVVIGSLRGSRTGNVHTSMDASLAQAENLKLAQQRILEIEKENDRLRQENEEVSSAADIIRSRLEEMTARITGLEREKAEVQEAAQNEIMILKGNLQFKESEVAKARLKIDELDTRLRNDFKKIRVKERELENRLELARAEKAALVRAKDENILELKRKIDQSQSEIDNYREKLLELNKTIEANQDQFKRTVRALRLALANLEAKDDNIVPLKKAE